MTSLFWWRSFKLLAVWVLLACYAPAVFAFTFQPTELQYALMPDYCKARMSDFHRNRKGLWNRKFPINEKQIAYWRKAIGPDWVHMHHYCAGLVYLSKGQSPSEYRNSSLSERQIYERAMGEINYTRSRSREGAPLWDQMTVDYARATEGAGGREKALGLLSNLLQISPKNTDVYLALAQTLERGHDLNGAVAVLEQGTERLGEKGPFLFYLARFYYELGDIDKAGRLTSAAEAAGMKMDSLRQRLDPQLGINTTELKIEPKDVD